MDPVSDMLIRIKNAQKAGHELLCVPHSKFKQEIAKTLSRIGYIGKVEVRGKRTRKNIEIGLLYVNNRSVINGLMVVSKPGRRLYTSFKNLYPSRRGGVILLTTSKGVLTGKEARREKTGGQLIAEVW